jgi:hypothetical protein
VWRRLPSAVFRCLCVESCPDGWWGVEVEFLEEAGYYPGKAADCCIEGLLAFSCVAHADKSQSATELDVG